MKKICTLFLLCVMAMTAAAESTVKTFTNTLKVTVDGLETSQEATVKVEILEDNLINFVLPNFALGTGDDAVAVGNIEINNLYLRDKGLYDSFTYNANLTIKPGDTPGVTEWLGPELGNLPLALTGKMSDTDLFVNIDLNLMETLGQIVGVQFGTDFAPAKATGEKTFTADLDVAMCVGGATMPLPGFTGVQTTAVYYDNGTADLILHDVYVNDGSDNLPFGNIVLRGVEITESAGYKRLDFSANAVVEAGTEGVEWLMTGAELSAMLRGKMTDSQLYLNLNVTMGEEGSFVFTFGNDFAPATPAGAAKVYDDQIVVSVNDYTTDAIPASVEVTPLTDGGINFTLKNFQMTGEDLDMKVGNINIEDLALYEGPGYKYFNYTGSIFITPGDEAGVAEEDWIGPMLGQIPLRMRGRITDNKLYVTIDIDMVDLGQVIFVTFGSKIEADPLVGISTVAPAASNTRAIYDLQGRKGVRNAQGIRIEGGKLVIR